MDAALSAGSPGEAALQHNAEVFFATYRAGMLPLHAALVDTICKAENVPLEFATVLEDVGQAYIGFAAQVTDYDPRADDLAEARIERFVRSTVARIGKIKLPDGRKAIEGFPAATDALRAALMVAMMA